MPASAADAKAVAARVYAAVVRFFSPEDEPLRRRLYGICAPALAVLVTFGLIQSSQADIIAGAVGYVLLIPVTEWARAGVTPVATLRGGKHRAKT